MRSRQETTWKEMVENHQSEIRVIFSFWDIFLSKRAQRTLKPINGDSPAPLGTTKKLHSSTQSSRCNLKQDFFVSLNKPNKKCHSHVTNAPKGIGQA